MATIEDGATSSVAIASIAGKAGTPAESYAKQVGIGFSAEVVGLTAEAGAGGTMSVTGNYLLPKKLQRATSLNLQIKADRGYQISDVQVDGASLSAAKGQSSYTLSYPLQNVCFKGHRHQGRLRSGREAIGRRPGRGEKRNANLRIS